MIKRGILMNAKRLVCIFLSLMLLTSCMTTKTAVGQYREQTGEEYTYAKGKQVWVFWGLIPLGRTAVSTPSSGDCKVITRLNIVDLLLGTVTCGFITTSTIKVKAKRVAPVQTSVPAVVSISVTNNNENNNKKTITNK
ncbi:MAG: hypothetical protein WBG43_04495 [Marinifilaceae bacterium]